MGENSFCGDPIDNTVYLHTIIIGLACIPTSFWLPLCVHKLGAKFFIGELFLEFSLATSHNFISIFLYFSLQFNGGWRCNNRTLFCG